MTDHNAISCRDWNEEIYKIPLEEISFRPSIYGVIIRDEKILLCPQRDGYDFPGGGMEKGETFEVALKREVREETGIYVKMEEIIHCDQDFYYHIPKQKAWNCILLYATCSNIQGEISDAELDTEEKTYARKAQWIPLAEIERIKFHNPVDSVAVIRKAMDQISL